MRTHRSFHPARILGGLALAVALALGAGPLAAQETGAAAADSTPLDLVFVVFPEPAGAGDALAAMSDTERQNLGSYAVVSKDSAGKVTVQDRKDASGGSQNAQNASQAIDGVVALLGRPTQDTQNQQQAQADTGGGQADTSAYAPEGGQAAGGAYGVSDADMGRMSGMLEPGGSALILVVEDPDAEATETAMKGAEGSPEVVVVDVIPVQ
jgi:uncharacterized membrane protein